MLRNKFPRLTWSLSSVMQAEKGVLKKNPNGLSVLTRFSFKSELRQVSRSFPICRVYI